MIDYRYMFVLIITLWAAISHAQSDTLSINLGGEDTKVSSSTPSVPQVISTDQWLKYSVLVDSLKLANPSILLDPEWHNHKWEELKLEKSDGQ